jgi:uncharacterized membrane protein
MPWLLAHAGGWDELLMFGIPVVLAIVAVRMVESRAKAKRESVEVETEQVTVTETPVTEPREGSP